MSTTPISRQQKMELTAEELRLITIRRGLSIESQELLYRLAAGFAKGAAQRGEFGASTASTDHRPRGIRLAASLGKAVTA